MGGKSSGQIARHCSYRREDYGVPRIRRAVTGEESGDMVDPQTNRTTRISPGGGPKPRKRRGTGGPTTTTRGAEPTTGRSYSSKITTTVSREQNNSAIKLYTRQVRRGLCDCPSGPEPSMGYRTRKPAPDILIRKEAARISVRSRGWTGADRQLNSQNPRATPFLGTKRIAAILLRWGINRGPYSSGGEHTNSPQVEHTPVAKLLA